MAKKQIITADYLVAEYKRAVVLNGGPVTQLRFYELTANYDAALYRLFGSWEKLVNASGGEIDKSKRRKYTHEDLIAAYKRVQQQLGGAHFSLQKFTELSRISSPTIYSRFGSWVKFVAAAGGDVTKIHKEYTADGLIDAYKQVQQQLGGAHFSSNKFAELTRISLTTIDNWFGAWSKFVAAAGGGDSGVRKTYTAEELIAAHKKIQQQLHGAPFSCDKYIELSKISQDVILRLFGTWAKFVAAAGGDIDAVKKAKYTADDLIAVYVKVQQQLGGVSLSKQKYGQMSGIYDGTIRRLFGTWRKFVAAAGGDVTLLLRTHTAGSLIAEYKLVHRQLGGAYISSNKFYELSGIAYNTIKRLFGTWKKLIAAAGGTLEYVSKPKHTTKSVAAAYRRLQKQMGGVPIALKTFCQRAGVSEPIVYKLFGSWVKFVSHVGGITYQDSKRSHTPESVIAAYKQLQEQVGNIPISLLTFTRKTGVSWRKVRELFGDWANFVSAAGGRLKFIRKANQTSESVLAAYKQLQRQMGGAYFTYYDFSTKTGVSHYVVHKLFGSWTKFVAVAGGDATKAQRRYTAKELIAAYKQVQQQLGVAYFPYTMFTKLSGISPNTVYRRFGSWRKFAAVAGGENSS